jgi:hypothetical protein
MSYIVKVTWEFDDVDDTIRHVEYLEKEGLADLSVNQVDTEVPEEMKEAIKGAIELAQHMRRVHSGVGSNALSEIPEELGDAPIE